MTLWQLLIAICFATPVMGMIALGKKADLSPSAWVAAMGTAAAVGFGCAFVMWFSGRTLARRSQTYSVTQEVWISRGLYAGGVLWMLGVSALSVWLCSTMVKLIRQYG